MTSDKQSKSLVPVKSSDLSVVKAGTNKDPLNLFREKLIKEGNITEDQIKTIDNRAKGDADASAEFADASPYPDPSELMDDIYWETDNPDKKTSQGTMFFETPA